MRVVNKKSLNLINWLKRKLTLYEDILKKSAPHIQLIVNIRDPHIIKLK